MSTISAKFIESVAKKIYENFKIAGDKDNLNVRDGQGHALAVALFNVELIMNSITATDDLKSDAFSKVLDEVESLIANDDETTGGSIQIGMSQGWYTDSRKSSIDWVRWSRYRELLVRQQKPWSVITSVGEVTDQLMDCIQDPEKPGSWSVKGLVVGYVQSGKTQNYIGLISKALDAGYKLVIVLAGLHDSLRVQTQNRIDDGLIGLDSGKTQNKQQGHRVGIGLDPSIDVPAMASMTFATQTGDFKSQLAQGLWNPNLPTVMVVKKNASILQNLINWVTAFVPQDGSGKIKELPVLIIDDEADNASINIGTEEDPARINSLIRKLKHSFEKSSYVGYTATPFANVLQNPDEATHPEFGENLFPEQFIIRLPEPNNYIGPAKVFGVQENVGDKEISDGLPGLIKINDDARAWLPSKHKANHFNQNPGDRVLPETLKEALCSFALSGAIRDLRGQKAPNSMLIHVSRFNLIQNQIIDDVREFLEEIKVTLQFGQNVQSDIWELLKKLHSEYKETTEKYLEHEDYYSSTQPVPNWSEVKPALANFIDRVELKLINGKATDVIDYTANPTAAVIALGGDKLSRGLTLEGLTVSYYLRESVMYDTLMQMGRWFGYRDGYLDLCRLYATSRLVEDFAYITLAAEELYSSFDELALLGDATPRTFRLKVRAHPGYLKVTAIQKSRGSVTADLDYAGTISETTMFLREARKTNLEALAGLLASSFPVSQKLELKKDSSYTVVQSKTESVLNFLQAYKGFPGNYRVEGDALSKYIDSRLNPKNAAENSELTEWHILVASPKGGTPNNLGLVLPDQQPIRMVERAGNPNRGHGEEKYAFARLVTPEHELYDCPEGSARWREAMDKTIELWNLKNKDKDTSGLTVPANLAYNSSRLTRSKNIGLLMIYLIDPISDEFRQTDVPYVGFGISFPGSAISGAVKWQFHPYFEGPLDDDK